MESLNKGWLYGLIVMLAQTCNPDYKEPSPFRGGYEYSTEQKDQVVEIPEDVFDSPMVEEAPPPMNEEPIFKVVEDMPRFPGCEDVADKNERKNCARKKMLEYIYSQMKYPEAAKKQGVEGRAILQFTVDKDGSINNVRLLRAPSTECGEEAIRVVKSMPKWIPGKQRGRIVKVQYTLPVNFKL